MVEVEKVTEGRIKWVGVGKRRRSFGNKCYERSGVVVVGEQGARWKFEGYLG